MRYLQLAITALCLLSALWLVVLLIRDRTPDRRLLHMMLGIELMLILHLVVGIVKATDAPTRVSVWEYVGYLVGVLLLIPVGLVWSAGERTRGGTGVLLVAVLVVPFMFARLTDIWAGHG